MIFGLGDIDYDLKQYSTAREHYKKYFETCPQGEWDQLAAQNYAICISSARDFAELGDVCRGFSAKWNKDMVFKRMVFLSDVFTGETEKAAESVKYITNQEYADSLYGNLDYNPAMAYFKSIGDNENALKYALKLIEVDPENVNTWAEVASLYLVNGQNDEAIEAINSLTDAQLNKLARIMDNEAAEYTVEDSEDIVLRPDILDILNED